jgi:hypothetical protein
MRMMDKSQPMEGWCADYIKSIIIPFTDNDIEFYIGWDGYTYAAIFTGEFNATWHFKNPDKGIVCMDSWGMGNTYLEALEDLVYWNEQQHPWHPQDRVKFMYVGGGDLE